MRLFHSLPRLLLAALATLFAAAAILYSAVWTFYGSSGVPVELGFDNKYLPFEHCQLVQSVVRDSPAERAGMKRGDCIVEINGAPLQGEDSLTRVWTQHKPGDAVELTLRRPGVSSPLVLHATFRASSSALAETGVAQHLGQGILHLFPVAFLVVGLAVLFLRLEDPNAWLLALMFGGFIAIPGFANSFLGVPPSVRPLAVAYRAVFNNMVAAFFYFFFAVFPTRSPLDRRLPWLKWFALAVGAILALPALSRSNSSGVAALGWLSAGYGHILVLCFNYGLIALGFVSLTWNAVSGASSEARRKIRVILWGTLVGVIPATLALAASDFFGFHITLLLGATIVLLLWLFPLSFAYAVVRHRVLEIPVLIRRSARYLLVQRGFIVLLFVVAACAIALFTKTFSRFFGGESNIGMAASAVFGIVMVWAAAPLVKRGTERIDRAFFRSAYDGRVILLDLAEKARTVNDRHELAALIERHIEDALHPKSLAVYFEAGDESLAVERGTVPPGLKTISTKLPFLSELARSGKSWDVLPPEDSDDTEKSLLAATGSECLVPILGRDSRLMGLLILGQRLSEEPYSGEDKHLLDSVASQAGFTLESIRMAEEIAERMQIERRAADEMEIARQVQSRLFPQTMPPLQTLEYAGGCIQARRVGGDYYDFLDLGPGRLGLVLADISGKGISGALLMANLQANLRSQYAIALEDLPRLLKSVNRLFYENTPNDSYATLFFGDYDDATRRLRYANCGHNAPLLLRANGTLERLPATTTVLGLFREWECPTAVVTLLPGDTLVVYTDGITEAADGLGQEFGETRLIEAVRSKRDLPVSELLASIHATVQQFSGGTQADDLTLVIGRVR